MSEIKFRAYGKIDCYYLTINGWKPEYKMCEVSSLNIKTNKCRVLYKGEKNTNEYDTFILSKVNLMQFTGLKDKKGVDIYEGDIVKYSDNHIENTIYEIPKLRDCFITNQIGYELETRKDAYCEIIGNIYENLEFIK